jgi:hypothetical protein
MFPDFSIRRIHAAVFYLESDAVGSVSDSMFHSAKQAALSILQRFIHTIWNNDSHIDSDCCHSFAVWCASSEHGPRKHINATKSLLTAARISPFLSEQAAESLLQ